MSRFRCTLHWLRAAALFASGGLWIAKRQLSLNRAIVVLAFHRVLNNRDLARTNSLSGMIMERNTFEKLTAYVARRYPAVAPGDTVFSSVAPTLRVAFTFDDGWLDTCTVALPIAIARGIPLTVFVCPGLMGRKAPFWPERVAAVIKAFFRAARESEIETVVETLKRCAPAQRNLAMAMLDTAERDGLELSGLDSTISWEQAAAMVRAGVAIGSHTQTHQILTTVPESDARPEVCASKAALEQQLNQVCRLFSYPNGNDSPHLRRTLAAAGYELAFTMRPGAWTRGSDRFAIPRINMCEENVVGPSGRFSQLRFEYTVFWQAWRNSRAGWEKTVPELLPTTVPRGMARSMEASPHLPAAASRH